ncbi:MAG TPA: hypothetical protein VN616_05360, partial [Puia sp.]|nr:hypothetical protein [Puia sp.]
VPAGTTDTCLSTLTIGGASYADSVYVLTNNKKVADPYFNASLTAANPCQNGNTCNFDITGSAASQHVYMNPHSGELDLEKTLKGTGIEGGVFGLMPVDGQTVTTDFYYQISDDPSNNAVQHMTIQFVFYNSQTLIDAGLLTMVNKRFGNLVSGSEISTTFNPKPPLIVIVRHN